MAFYWCLFPHGQVRISTNYSELLSSAPDSTYAVFGVLGSILIQKQGQESFSNFLSCVFVGVDEVTIINILTNRNNEQRQDIAFAYQRRTKKVDMKR